MSMGFSLGKGGGGGHHHHHGGHGRGGFGPAWYGPGYWENQPSYIVVAPPSCGEGTYPASDGTCRAVPPGMIWNGSQLVRRGLFSRLRGLRGLGQTEIGNMATANPVATTVWGVLSAVSAGASAYHGYKRNNSVGWAIVWGLLGGIFPILVPAIAIAEGFGKRAR